MIYYCCCPQTSLENLENLDCERPHILIRDRRASEINLDPGPLLRVTAKVYRDRAQALRVENQLKNFCKQIASVSNREGMRMADPVVVRYARFTEVRSYLL